MEKALSRQTGTLVKKILLTGDPVHWKEDLCQAIGIHAHQVSCIGMADMTKKEQTDYSPDLVIVNLEKPPPAGQEAISFTKTVKHFGKAPVLVFSSQPPRLEIVKALMLAGVFIEKYRSVAQSIAAVNLLVSSESKNERFVNWFRSRNLRPVLSRKVRGSVE